MHPELLKNRLAYPRRAELMDKLERANRNAWLWVGMQLLALVGVVAFIDWRLVVSEPLVSTVAIAVMIGPTSMGILRLWAQRKKEIGDLKESTRFGEFDKHRLRMLQRDTLRRLGLPDERIPVYITAEKSLNASALRLGLGAFFRSLNGIYLHRQLLYHLDSEEVQDIMGHELGHYYRYYLVSDRFRALTVVLGGSIGILAAQITGMTSFVSVIISFVCASVFWTVAGMPWSKYGKVIEYLCDDFGAQVHGVHVSINGLLKLGAEAEMQLAVQQQAILSQRNGNLNARDVVEAVEAAIPYGRVSRDELEKSVEQSIKQRARDEQQLSVAGFLKYVWQSDTDSDVDEQIEEQAKKLKLLQSIPRLDWESLLADKTQIRFGEHEVHRLIELMESRPQEALFRIPEEVGPTGDVHPPLRQRILYLWHNRDEIGRSRYGAGR